MNIKAGNNIQVKENLEELFNNIKLLSFGFVFEIGLKP